MRQPAPPARAHLIRALVACVTCTTLACAAAAGKVAPPLLTDLGLLVLGVLGILLLLAAASAAFALGRRQRHSLSASLALSEERYRRMVEIANEGIWTLDADLRATFVNAKLAERLGFAPDDMLRLPVTAFMFPEDYADHAVQMRARRDGHRGTYERRLRCHDGSTRWTVVAETPVFDGGGRFAGLLAMLTDITERKHAEQALVESEARLRAIVDSSAEGIVTIDDDARVRSLNPEAERLFGWPANEAAALPVIELLPGFPTLDSQAVGHTHEMEGRRRGGDAFPLSFSLSEFTVDHRHERTLMIRDLTATKLAEAELKAVQAQLAQAQRIEAVGRLASGVAHDFNNLLGIINGFGEMARRDLPEDHPVQRRLTMMLQAAEKGAGLTRQLLAFSRRQALEPRNVDLGAIVLGIEGMLRRVLGEDVRLVVRARRGLGTIRVDPGQIEQVLLNLVVNARDAMPQGGELTITTEALTSAPERPWGPAGLPPGRYVHLTVQDTGCGMDAPVLARIFEPFFTTKPQGHGTGLGLATVYGIVTQSGGYVRAESEAGAGTVFHVVLPLHESEERPLGAGRTEDAPQKLRGSETVLVVEDDSTLRDIIVESLAAYGYRVLAAADGASALAVAATFVGRVNLLLTDVIMPNMSGKELADRLRAHQPATRVLFMSGYTSDAIERYEVTGDGMAFIQKPFTAEVLLGHVRAVLDSGVHVE